MKGKDLKQAKVVKIELDKVRSITFDFNALCELQDFFIDPFIAVAAIGTGDVKSLRALLYASLVAGQLVEDENVEFDLTINQVGRLLGQIMATDTEKYEQIFTVILEGVALFFPDKKEKTETDVEVDEKN